MDYRIDVPSLITSGVQLSGIEKFSDVMREYVASRTDDVAELAALAGTMLQQLPHAVWYTQPQEVAAQSELLGAFMRWVYRSSPYFHGVWRAFGWDGVSGLSAASDIFRTRYVYEALQREHLTRLPTFGDICTYMRRHVLDAQWRELCFEYGLRAARTHVAIYECATDADSPAAVVDGRTIARRWRMASAPYSGNERHWLCGQVKLGRVDVLITTAQMLETLANDPMPWSSEPIRLLLTIDPVDAATATQLRLAGVCTYVAQWVPGSGHMPALLSCKFDKVHAFPLLQRLEQVGDSVMVTDLFSFSLPVFRTVAGMSGSYLASGSTQQCCCGRYDRWTHKLKPVSVW